MAEVGQRLCGGACRLSAVISCQSRPVITGGDPGSLPVACASVVGPVGDRTAWYRHEDEIVSQFRAAKPKVNGGSERRLEEVLLLRTPVNTQSYCVLGKSPPAQKSSVWMRRDVSIPSFTNSQQLRSICTVVLIQRLSCGWKLLLVNPVSPAAARTYCRSSVDAPLLHRSRTTYYDILRVTPAATQSQIKTAYYKQSLIYHPDKNPNSTEATLRFTEISEAYTVLRNTSLRRKYDLGILSQSDVRSAGRPSSKEASSSRPKGPPHQQQKTWRFYQHDGKPIFDFDAFYEGHYGEQLRREKMRARKQMEEMQKKKQRKLHEQKFMLFCLTMAMATLGGLTLLSVSKT